MPIESISFAKPVMLTGLKTAFDYRCIVTALLSDVLNRHLADTECHRDDIVTITPKYSDFGSGEATVSMNVCDHLFHINVGTNATGTEEL